MKHNHVTLNDVARAAEVSPASVSRVLNGSCRSSDAVRRRVMAAAEALGYNVPPAPRAAATVGARRRNYRFELVLCPLGEQKNMLQLDYYNRILEGLQQVLLTGRNADLSLLTLSDSPDLLQVARERLLAADGVFVLGQQEMSGDFLEPALAGGVPVVTLERRCAGMRVNSVEHDDFESAIQMVELLAKRGIRSVGMLNIPGGVVFERRRLGLLLALRNGGAAICEAESCLAASSEDRDIRSAFLERLRKGGLPECMIATHLNAAIVMYDCLKENGLRCPRDLSIITFDAVEKKLPGTDTVFTGFRTMPEEMGRKAARRMFELLERPDETAHRIMLPLPFIEGNTIRGAK